MIDRSRRVVLLIDFDNLQICASRDTPGRDLQLEPVVQLAQRYGTVMLARAYAEWNLSTERLAVYKAGIEPAFAPVLRTESDRAGKSLADTVMVAEGMDVLWTLVPDVLVLATSDKDLIPLVRVAKQRGVRVVVVGSDFTAIPLREMADEHFTYKQLATEAGGKPGEGVPPRQAAQGEPSRRGARGREREKEREKEREPREPRAVAAPAAAPTVAIPPLEAVAPVAAGSEADGGIARRRRRRGSRRRGDRIGAAEGEAGQEAGSLGEAAPPGEGPVEEHPRGEGPGPEEHRPAPARDEGPGAAEPAPTAEAPAAPTADGAEPPAEGEAPATPARRPRARRVAGATRGRARPATE